METGGLNPSLRTERLKSMLLAAVIIVYVATLLPMLAIAKYNFAFGDDQLVGAPVGEVFAKTGSLTAALREAGNRVAYYYEVWQGTYAGVFLMALHPGVFGEQFYALTPLFMIGALTLSVLLFTRAAGKRLLNLDVKSRLILAFVILLFSVQFPPSAREAFYWYTGAVYYTFFHCLLLVLAALLILQMRAERSQTAVVYGILSVLLSAVIAGGNYATALPCGILLSLNLLWWSLCARRAIPPAHPRIGLAVSALTLVVFAAGMLVSVAAPGNAVRQSAVDAAYSGMSAPVAILTSFPLAFAAVLNRLDVGAVLLVGLIVLFATPAINRSGYAFRHPALAVLIAFCVFAAQFTPTLYAASSPGPLRLRNVVFFNFYWLLCFCTVYLTGAFLRRRELENGAHCETSCRERAVRLFARAPLLALFLAASLVAAMFLQRDLTQTPVYLSVTELADGTACAHAQIRRHNLLPEAEQAAIPLDDASEAVESGLLS